MNSSTSSPRSALMACGLPDGESSHVGIPPPPPPPVADTHTASPADAPKKPWTKPTIRTVYGEVESSVEVDPRNVIETMIYQPS